MNKSTNRNYVAKHGQTFNRSATHTDRSKAARRGYTKHRQELRLGTAKYGL